MTVPPPGRPIGSGAACGEYLMLGNLLAEDRKPDARRLLRFLRNPSQLGEILSSGGGKGLIL